MSRRLTMTLRHPAVAAARARRAARRDRAVTAQAVAARVTARLARNSNTTLGGDTTQAKGSVQSEGMK